MSAKIPYYSYAYQFAKAIHGSTSRVRAVSYRWHKIASGSHPEFTPAQLAWVAFHGGKNWSTYWDSVSPNCAAGRILTYLAGESW